MSFKKINTLQVPYWSNVLSVLLFVCISSCIFVGHYPITLTYVTNKLLLLFFQQAALGDASQISKMHCLWWKSFCKLHHLCIRLIYSLIRDLGQVVWGPVMIKSGWFNTVQDITHATVSICAPLPWEKAK